VEAQELGIEGRNPNSVQNKPVTVDKSRMAINNVYLGIPLEQGDGAGNGITIEIRVIGIEPANDFTLACLKGTVNCLRLAGI